MINIEILEEMFDGDKEITQQLFELYLVDNAAMGDTILAQYEANDLSGLFHTAHTLSGALGNLCEMDILPAIKEVEAAAKTENRPSKDTINIVVEGLNNIKKQMESHLNN
ncbi:Hpt domain-containing protein [Aliivibrio sp. EL58]|uniref:Hpt domain-containing protein n=1 Tax=Aliivibrio sp. EL58 TaxID=2107582 RepID=UPI000EFD1047|nr:Hpt domain-containing protein [Aliivibrio sp. EL58]